MQLTAGGLLQGGKYLLNHPLETQGFGITYRATQTQTGQSVVVKTLHPALHGSKAFGRLRDRFVDVGALMTKSPHASLVKVLDLFQEEQLPFMVMEYVAGTSLAEMVTPDRPMAELEALHYMRLVGGAIAQAHRSKLVHGNLKPQNILRRTGGNTPVRSARVSPCLYGSGADWGEGRSLACVRSLWFGSESLFPIDGSYAAECQ
jgi:serine/threonine protein kinase